MMMFGLFCLVKIFRFFLEKTLVDGHHRHHSLEGKRDINHLLASPEAKQDIRVSWSELDLNLLGEIIGRLTSPTDQARFHVICRTWLAVEPVCNITPAILPWFVGYNHSSPCGTGTLDLSLYEPSCIGNPTSVHNISLTQLGIPFPSFTRATCIKNWLFICTRLQKRSFYRRNFLLFSPFTKQVIKLPQSDYPFPFIFNRIFSTDPNSPDCVFFLSDTRCLTSSKIAILTYSNGDRQWTARQFDRADEFVPYQCMPIYLRGIFYLVSPIGQIASYDILTDEFRFENLVIDNQFEVNYCEEYRPYEIFEFNGYLMRINYGPLQRMHNDNFPGNPCIKRFDWASNAWVPVSRLGNQSLFVGKQFNEVGIAKARHNEELSNKIYYFSALGCLVYSLENGALVEHRFFSLDFTNPNTTNYYLANNGDLLGRHRSSRWKSLFGYGQDYWTTRYYWLSPPVVQF